ncbi:MAG: hypothetical protein N2578_08980, partial [Bdellovibrionaceae bacterium]|nr:hypothetical protein [Pseudobdellovibrionaceae bacterium]
ASVMLVSLASLSYCSSAWACKMSRDPKYNYFTSYESGTRSMFYEASLRQHSPTVIERCGQSGGKKLLLALGVRAQSFQSDVSEISFDGKFSPERCELLNSLSKNSVDAEARTGALERQFRALRTCANIQVYDLDGRHISYRPNQARCKITSIGNGVLQLEGDFCFLDVNPRNRFAVLTNIKPECADAKFLKKHNIQPQDIEGTLNAFLTGDDSGFSTDVDPLGSSRVRLYIQPGRDLMPLTEAYSDSMARFPTEYAADINIGHLKIRGSDQNYMVDLSVEVDNRGAPRCSRSFCAAPNDFTIPVVGEVELVQMLPGGRSRFIDSWWHAGFAHPQWQGLVRSFERNLNEITMSKGERYQLTVTFYDPFEDWQLFAKAAEQFLIDLRGTQGTAGIDMIAPLQGLQSLMGLPLLEALPSLRSPDMTQEMERILYALRTLGQDRQWPSYYERACDTEMSSCVRPGKVKFMVKVGVRFTVEGWNAADNIVQLRDYEVFRESSYLPGYTRRVKSLAEVRCGDRK